jgi:hypothetical protein
MMNRKTGIMGYKDGAAFAGPDTSTPFVKKESPGDVAREEYANLPTEIQTIKGSEDLPSVAVPEEDGIIKSLGTGVVKPGQVDTVLPASKDYLTRPVSTEPSEMLPDGVSLNRVTGKVKGIEVPAEMAAIGAVGTAVAGYKLLSGSSKLLPGFQPLGGGAVGGSAANSGASATALGVDKFIGGATAVLSLYDMYKNGLSVENGLGFAGGTALYISSVSAGVGAGSAAAGGWASGSFASSQALAVAGPLMLGAAALLVIYDALKKPSNKTGIAYSDVSAEEYTITQDGLTGDKYHQGNRDGASALLAPVLDYTRVMEEEYDTQIGGKISIQIGNERGLEIIVASEDGRIFIEKDFGRSETAVDEMYQWFDDITNFAAQSGVQDLAYSSAILYGQYDYVKGRAIERKNKYKYYSMPGADDYNILGEHYMMADGSPGQLNRTAHNAEFDRIDNEVTTAITQWREYLGTNWEWDRTPRSLDTSTTLNPDGSFDYKNSTFQDFTGFDSYGYTGLKKGGSIESLPKFVKSRIPTLKEGGTPDSAWGGSSGKIYNFEEPEMQPKESEGLLSPRLMATY